MVRAYHIKGNSIVRLLLTIGIIILILIMSGFVYWRIDLTEEKRHTLTPATIEMLENIEDVVYFKVYLKGEYPADFKRLERAVKDRLLEMKVYAGDNLEFEFIDPSASSDVKTRTAEYAKLEEEGLLYTSLQIRTNDGISEKIIFPGAIVSYRGKSRPLQILKSRERAADAEMINSSINNLEYDLARIIRTLSSDEMKSIAYVQGHGELPPIRVADLNKELEFSYNVNFIELDQKLNSLSSQIGDGKFRKNKYDLIIIAKPDSAFDEKDKFLIDQYVMRGGKVIWLLDAMIADLDSLRDNQQAMSVPFKSNLEDQLFSYGAHINSNLVLDKNCAPIGITTGQVGNQPKIELFPWYFKPLVINRNGHPIGSNLDPVALDFVSSIDTIPKPNIKKTVLLSTSENSRLLRSPVRINLNIVRIDPDFTESNVPFIPLAVLLEGEFTSSFANRIPPDLLDDELFSFIEKSEITSQLVVADGDIISNRINTSTGLVYPLGFDRYQRRKVYGNREFLLNAINYMLDEEGLISLRTRTIKLRQLSAEKVDSNYFAIQWGNMGLPLLLISIFGIIFHFLRRKNYKKG